jgi:hypothetical protein
MIINYVALLEQAVPECKDTAVKDQKTLNQIIIHQKEAVHEFCPEQDVTCVCIRAELLTLGTIAKLEARANIQARSELSMYQVVNSSLL